MRLGGGDLALGSAEKDAEGERDDAADENEPGQSDLRPPVGHEAAETSRSAPPKRGSSILHSTSTAAMPTIMPMMFVPSAPRVRVSIPTRKDTQQRAVGVAEDAERDRDDGELWDPAAPR